MHSYNAQVLEVVAEESAPALDYETLLESFSAGDDAVSDTVRTLVNPSCITDPIIHHSLSIRLGLEQWPRTW